MGVSALLAWALLIEPRRLVIRPLELALPGWPASLNGLRIAVIADLHTGGPHVDERRLERLVARVNREGADLVALLGDFVDSEVRLGQRIAPRRVAESLAGLRTRRGVYAILGNHDWTQEGSRVPEALAAAGIIVLENEAMRVPGAGELWLIGLADMRTRTPDVSAALRDVPADVGVIALSHDPDVFPSIPKRVALTLAGHTHGGQVGIPVLRRPLLPSRYGERYARGHVVERGRHLFVSAGVGEAGLPLRLLAPPEVVVLELNRADRAS